MLSGSHFDHVSGTPLLDLAPIKAEIMRIYDVPTASDGLQGGFVRLIGGAS